MKRLAGGIKKWFIDEDADLTVTVGSIVNIDGDGSAWLREQLVTNLKSQGFKISRSQYVVDGRFCDEFRAEKSADGVEAQFKSVALKVTAIGQSWRASLR
jgi:hypothetical protein